MIEAIRLAEKGKGKVEPNPLVGAVVVKNNKIVGKGYHEKFGEKHAEINALMKAGKAAMGADLYVTLEPCNHHGKQPPCTKTIIKAGIKRVFIGLKDPNKKSGNGARELKKHKIKVSGLEQEKTKTLSNFYITYIGSGKKPLITLKIAMTLDGFISWGNKKNKKISGKKAFEFTQKLRANNEGILVGVNTIINDDPKLTVRNGKSPLRIVLDSKARVPLRSKIFSENGNTIIVVTKKASKKRVEKIKEKGSYVLVAKELKGKIDLEWLMKKLYSIGVKSILVEPGSKIASSFLEKKLFDKFNLIVSPKKIGKGLKAFKLKRKINIKLIEKKKLGKDLLLVMK